MHTEPFGVVLCAYRGDFPLLRGCCASIRAHMPDVPICVIADGKIPVGELSRVYGVTVIERSDVDPRLHGSYGYGLTKMIAFWHAPFERFLYIDTDTICWGNVLNGLSMVDVDFICNEPHEIVTDAVQRSQYFDPDGLFEHVEQFDWKNRPYFNAGCFIARRGIFALDDYLDLLELQRRRPDILLCGDQGILNVLVFAKVARGEIRLDVRALQAVVPVISRQELKRRFGFRDGQPLLRHGDRRIIHWAGSKPFLTSYATFRDPMMFYRRVHRRSAGGRRLFDMPMLVLEDLHARTFGRLRARFRQLWRHGRRLAGAMVGTQRGSQP